MLRLSFENLTRPLAAAAVGVLLGQVLLPTAAQATDQEELLAKGEALYKNCKSCHQIGPGAANKVGPHLDGIIGRVAGSIDGFRYSSAMVKAGEEGLTWNEETIAAYLERPRKFIPGNRMSYRGMSKAEDRTALVTWLASYSQSAPAENPNTAEIATVPGFSQAVLDLEGDPDFGEYLAGECVTCHQQSGRADGIPSIVGLPKEYFIRSLFEYKANIRQNDVMQLRVQNLANDEIAALAAYFSSLQPE